MQYETIRYEVDDRVATITLNRPDRMNAFSHQLTIEIPDAVRRADQDPDARVVVVTGAGGRAFSSGYDIAADAEPIHGVEGWSDTLRKDLEFTYCVWRCSKPVIAMISGYCLGGALEFAQMCDMRYCSDDSKFGVVETRFASGIVTLAMPWVVGQRTREYIFSGDTFDADEAYRVGLVNRVFPKADLEAETMKIAKRISRVALAALQWNKRAINNTYETMGFNAALNYGVEACTLLDATETPENRAFEDIRRSQGLKAALNWRREQFAPYE